MELFIGIMIPFLGTCLGLPVCSFMKNELKPLVQKGLLGFASGVMVAASVWSLLIRLWICQTLWENLLSFRRQQVFFWDFFSSGYGPSGATFTSG